VQLHRNQCSDRLGCTGFCAAARSTDVTVRIRRRLWPGTLTSEEAVRLEDADLMIRAATARCPLSRAWPHARRFPCGRLREPKRAYRLPGRGRRGGPARPGRNELEDGMASSCPDEVLERGVRWYGKGASKDESAHRRRQTRSQDLLEHPPGSIRGQLYNRDRPTAPAASHHAVARRAKVAYPVGALLAVRRDQETAPAALEQVHWGRPRLSRLAAAHGEQDHRAHGYPRPQQPLDDPGDAEEQNVRNAWSLVAGRVVPLTPSSAGVSVHRPAALHAGGYRRLDSSKSANVFSTSYGSSTRRSGSHSLLGTSKKSPPYT
jgi:hypothetical protein